MKKVITISREYGAGGHSIGEKVAEELGIPFYDRDIVRETAKASGFERELIEKESEDVSRSNSILKSICAISSNQYRDTQQAIHDVQQAIILHFAMDGSCVILGRCADDILYKAGIDSFNVFIHASDVHRAVRLSKVLDTTNASEIQKLMAKKDNSRHTYYNHYTGKKWGDSRNYHLTLDSGALGDAMCIKLIVQSVLAMEE